MLLEGEDDGVLDVGVACQQRQREIKFLHVDEPLNLFGIGSDIHHRPQGAHRALELFTK